MMRDAATAALCLLGAGMLVIMHTWWGVFPALGGCYLAWGGGQQ